MSTWTIRLLGGFAVERGGEPLPQLPSRKGVQLFVSLALRFGRTRTREELAELIWPASEPELARNSLRQTLTHLHKWLGDDNAQLLEADRLGIRLNPSNARCDLAEFEDAVHRAKIADQEAEAIECWSKAVCLVKGPLVPGVTLEWMEPERVHLAQQLLSAHLALAKALASQGDLREALTVAQKAISLDALQEDATALFMEISSQADMPNQGLLAYRSLEQRSIVELGIPPSNRLQKLASDLRASGSSKQGLRSPSARATSNVPALPWPLIGRGSEQRKLISTLSPSEDQSPQILTLTGLGGIGKSHLAMDVAQRLVEAYSGAVWFVSLVQAAPDDVEKRVGDAVLKSTASGSAGNLQAVADAVGNDQALLVIDNAEDLLNEVRTFTLAVCSKCPALKVLVTSREPLGLPNEMEAQLTSLAIPNESEHPLENECVQLYLSHANRALHQVDDSEPALADIAQLCRALDGMPLAIVLAASRARVQSPREVLESVESFRSNRRGTALGRPEQSSTVNSCIAWSCNRLGDASRTLAGMTCFVGGCTAGAIQALCPDRDIAADLERLAAYSLVQTKSTSVGTRFDMLESVRQFAIRQMNDDEAATARTAHANFFEGFVRDRALEFSSGKQREAVAAIAVEDGNTLAALRFLASAAPARAVKMAIDLIPYWDGRGRCQEALALGEPLLESAAGIAPESDLATLRHRLAVMQRHLGRYGAALNNMLQCVRVRRESGEELRLAETLSSLGNLLLELGDDIEASLASLQEANSLFLRLEHRRGQAMVAGNLGRTYHYGGENELAVEHLERALGLNREMGNSIWEMTNLGELAEIALERGDLHLAANLLNQAISIRDSLQMRTNTSIFICLSELHEMRGDVEEAYRVLSEAFHLARENSGQLDIGNALRSSLRLLIGEGRYLEAARCAGIEDSLRTRANLPIPRPAAPRLAAHLGLLQDALGPDFREEFAIGRSWAPDPALDWVESLLGSKRLAIKSA